MYKLLVRLMRGRAQLNELMCEYGQANIAAFGNVTRARTALKDYFADGPGKATPYRLRIEVTGMPEAPDGFSCWLTFTSSAGRNSKHGGLIVAADTLADIFNSQRGESLTAARQSTSIEAARTFLPQPVSESADPYSRLRAALTTAPAVASIVHTIPHLAKFSRSITVTPPDGENVSTRHETVITFFEGFGLRNSSGDAQLIDMDNSVTSGQGRIRYRNTLTAERLEWDSEVHERIVYEMLRPLEEIVQLTPLAEMQFVYRFRFEVERCDPKKFKRIWSSFEGRKVWHPFGAMDLSPLPLVNGIADSITLPPDPELPHEVTLSSVFLRGLASQVSKPFSRDFSLSVTHRDSDANSSTHGSLLRALVETDASVAEYYIPAFIIPLSSVFE